jgi:hypothetical protein
MMTYLADKYKVLPDARTFLGHTEIWKNPGPHLLDLEGWNWVQTQFYADAEFKTAFPERLDSDLVPLEFRNKAIQKWKNARRSAVVSAVVSDEETPEPPVVKKVIIVPEMDEDW